MLTRSDPGWVRPADETGLLQFSSAGQQQVETHIGSTNEQRLHSIVASSSTEVPSDVTRPEISRADIRRGTDDEADIEMSEIHISDVPELDSSTQVAGTDAAPVQAEVAINMNASQQSADHHADFSTCRHCEVQQLVRTKHCRDCGRCVYTFDHHCFWIGTCVGEGNRRLFWWYLLVEFVTDAWASSHASSTFYFHDGPQWAERWLLDNVTALGALGISGGFAMLLGGLLFFHTYLICTGQTSWEVTRRSQVTYMRNV
eukprot:CAMPEP_0172170070 /NCGR_PEP_ID=MMETSP1050-20130122/11058_1 /TAXON_ID=233186 /ORGANISM="Cryptomonas curvata, Strain CCAP979/52" /LENGTH=257 /DNA_ID=CAMNT_0012841201 /DNA_START=140 /DNA_END=910 /DNA_ORIENTATION=+